MIRKNIHLLILFPILLICTQCATVSSPTGGAKDETGPILMESTIESGSTNFNEKSIILTFSEYVKIDNPAQNVYSSPPMGNTISFVTKKNKLIIVFKEELEENTTYHLNFGNSIKDVNESNSLNNYHFVFATGDDIDSLNYQGRILAINDAEITENTLIGLYKQDSLGSVEGDSSFLKRPPFYFTFIEQNGNFILDYLKAGTYRVFALTDRNNNYYYDLPNEAIGFLDSTLSLSENFFLAEVPLFIPEESEGRVQSFTNTISDYKIEYEISKSIPTEDLFSMNAFSDSIPLSTTTIFSEDRKKITAWIGKELNGINSIQTVLLWNNVVVDTFQHTVSQLKFPKLEIEINTTEASKNDSLIISLSNPMDTPCLNIALIDTSNNDTIATNITKHSDFQLVAKFSKAPSINVVYTLLRADSCLSDIYGQYADLPAQNLKIVDEEERGIMILKFEGIDPEKNYLIDLQNAEKKNVTSLHVSTDNSKVIIKNLVPGNYTLQIIEDANKNGVWNSGSLIPRKLPEKIYSYPKEFILRPNWELEESINLGAP